MGLINLPKKIELTDDQKKIRLANQLKLLINPSFSQMKFIFDKITALVWEHPEFSPQEVVDTLGPDAKELFTFMGRTQEFMNLVAPESNKFVAPSAYKMNEDGTVEIASKK